MPTIPLTIADPSAFARALRLRLGPLKELPAHEAMLSHLAAAAGYRNWQRLVTVVQPTPDLPPPIPMRCAVPNVRRTSLTNRAGSSIDRARRPCRVCDCGCCGHACLPVRTCQIRRSTRS